MLSLETIPQAWHAFFFTPESALTLAVFRILFGILLFVHGLLNLREARKWWGVDGVYPYAEYLKMFRQRIFSLFHYLPAKNSSVYLLLAVYLVASVGIILGLFTNLCAAVVFLILRSFDGRNPYVERGNDMVLSVMCFLLIFSGAGASLSLDNMLGLWHAGSTGTPGQIVPWCTRLLQLQVSIIYLRNAFWKSTGTTWRAGTASYYSLELRKFQRLPFPPFLRQPVLLKLGTWSVLFLEFALATLIWVPALRLPLVILGISMHLFFDLFLNIELFGTAMTICLLLFVPPNVTHTILQNLHLLHQF